MEKLQALCVLSDSHGRLNPEELTHVIARTDQHVHEVRSLALEKGVAPGLHQVSPEVSWPEPR